MSSWEDIANEIVPLGSKPSGGLATGVRRTSASHQNRGIVVERNLACQPSQPGDHPDTVWGGKVVTNEAGSFYLIEKPITYYDDQAGQLASRLAQALDSPPSSRLANLDSRELLFFDIETMGLSSSTPLFLIGTMTFTSVGPIIRLYLARTKEEEAAVITAFASDVPGKTLISFNGQSFDWPYVAGRATRLGVPLIAPLNHFDLLFACRKRWRGAFVNCRLQTLEQGVCRRGREGDIPSAQIPERYQHFLQTGGEAAGGAHLLAPVLFHNALDVLTMGELICHLSEEG